MTNYVLPMDTSEAALETVGGKGKSLASMTSAGFAVPTGFYVTADAYRHFVEEKDLQTRIVELAKPDVVNGSASFQAASQNIQALFKDANLNDEIVNVILEAYQSLDASAVAVRSSANAEDLPDLSFAGQQDTYLNVHGEDELIQAVTNCWASLWTERAIAYRHENDIDQASVAMAVVVQKMVPADVAGTLFTANPVTGERAEIIVNGSFGLGEAVVSGEVTPDTYVIDRESFTINESIIGGKLNMIVAEPRERSLPKCLRPIANCPHSRLSRLMNWLVPRQKLNNIMAVRLKTSSGPLRRISSGCCNRGRLPACRHNPST